MAETKVLSESRTLNFECGCFVSLFVDEGVLREAMACCTRHEEAHQSLDNILKTHFLSIEKKYVAPIKRSNMGLDDVKLRHPELIVTKQNNGSTLLQFTVADIPVETVLHPQFPHFNPSGFFAPVEHQRVVLYASRMGGWNASMPSNGELAIYSNFYPLAWHPGKDDAFTWVRLVETAIKRKIKPEATNV